MKVEFYLSTCKYPGWLVPYAEDDIFSPVCIVGLFVKNKGAARVEDCMYILFQ